MRFRPGFAFDSAGQLREPTETQPIEEHSLNRNRTPYRKVYVKESRVRKLIFPNFVGNIQLSLQKPAHRREGHHTRAAILAAAATIASVLMLSAFV